MNKKQAAEEADQIQRGNIARLTKKSEVDMQNMDDLKTLEKLENSDSNGQLQGLTDQAA